MAVELLLLPEAPKGPCELRDTAGLQKTVLALGTAGISPALRHPQKDGVGLRAHVTKPIHKHRRPACLLQIFKSDVQVSQGCTPMPGSKDRSDHTSVCITVYKYITQNAIAKAKPMGSLFSQTL